MYNIVEPSQSTALMCEKNERKRNNEYCDSDLAQSVSW